MQTTTLLLLDNRGTLASFTTTRQNETLQPTIIINRAVQTIQHQLVQHRATERWYLVLLAKAAGGFVDVGRLLRQPPAVPLAPLLRRCAFHARSLALATAQDCREEEACATLSQSVSLVAFIRDRQGDTLRGARLSVAKPHCVPTSVGMPTLCSVTLAARVSLPRTRSLGRGTSLSLCFAPASCNRSLPRFSFAVDLAEAVQPGSEVQEEADVCWTPISTTVYLPIDRHSMYCLTASLSLTTTYEPHPGESPSVASCSLGSIDEDVFSTASLLDRTTVEPANTTLVTLVPSTSLSTTLAAALGGRPSGCLVSPFVSSPFTVTHTSGGTVHVRCDVEAVDGFAAAARRRAALCPATRLLVTPRQDRETLAARARVQSAAALLLADANGPGVDAHTAARHAIDEYASILHGATMN